MEKMSHSSIIAHLLLRAGYTLHTPEYVEVRNKVVELYDKYEKATGEEKEKLCIMYRECIGKIQEKINILEQEQAKHKR